MAYSVIPTETFESEYGSILGYIAETLGAPKAAGDLADALDCVRIEISENPFLYAVSRKPAMNGLELRERLMRGYVVVYRVSGDNVYLEHIFHQSQDFAALKL